MAFTLRFAGGFLLRNSALIRASNRSTTKLFSTEGGPTDVEQTNVEQTDVEQTHVEQTDVGQTHVEHMEVEDQKPAYESLNHVSWAGIAVDDCSDSHVIHVKNSLDYKLRFKSPRDKEIRSIFQQIKAGMNVAIEGELQQSSAIVERDSRFVLVRSEYIKVKKIEILDSDEAVEKKKELVRGRIMGQHYNRQW